jgi:3-deoxy-D-manno-octulosonate 8-phosphate phosphatase (KDO 8-P phosphatase)
VLDVDGVMTDGSIYVDHDGREAKRFHVRDGFAIKLWQRLGLRLAIITGRTSSAVKHRARELAIDLVVQGCPDKGAAVETMSRETGVKLENMACLADDWPELPMMCRVGYPMAVADAEPAVRRIAAFVTPRPGGQGAVRDGIEHIILKKGLMERALALYDSGDAPRS